MAYLTYNSKILARSGKWIDYSNLGPTLPPYTIRLKFTEGVTPTFRKGTATQVSVSPNIWDLYYNNSNWSFLLDYQLDLLEVLGANSTGVTSTSSMFLGCINLSRVPLFDMTRVTKMESMFSGCTSLDNVPSFTLTNNTKQMTSMFMNCTSMTSIPLLNTTNTRVMTSMFAGCTNVQTGALAFYTQASQNNIPYYVDAFMDCGTNTQTGSAELAQIPKNWGGTSSAYESGSFTSNPWPDPAPYTEFRLGNGYWAYESNVTARPSYNVIKSGIVLSTPQSIASVANIPIDKSLIVNRENGFSTSRATYYYPAFIQQGFGPSTSNTFNWAMITANYAGYLSAGQYTGTISGTLNPTTTGAFTYEMGTYRYAPDNHTVFAYLVTNHPIASNADFNSSEYAGLKCDYYRTTTFNWHT